MSEVKYPNKDRFIAIVLSYFVGIVGGHLFYVGEKNKGLKYLALSWTAIPFFLGLYDGYKYFKNPEWFSGSPNTSPTTGVEEGETSGVEQGTQSASNKLADDAVISATGTNGKVTLYDDRLEISREDIGMMHKMQHGFKGHKEIPYDSITSIQLRKPSSVTNGYIQFGQKGYSEDDDGLLDATSDENTVLFSKKSLSDFEEVRTKVRALKKGNIKESTESMDGAMEKLRKRYAEGEIDEEEYEQRKEILRPG